ncbi:MAG: PQQ-binding-like beta-propeller repeat protein, partial [Proteobacteria bacterium]|nr:PQQ-binding-like beta-propeller repeat protein [Pseudomonadota bacterium]
MKKVVILLLVLLIVSCSSNKKKNETVPNDLEKLDNVGSFTIMWKKKLDGADGAFGYKLNPSFNKGNLYVATQEGAVYSIDATSGETNWKSETEIELSAGPGVSDTLIVVGSPEGKIIALDVESGATIWNTNVTS